MHGVAYVWNVNRMGRGWGWGGEERDDDDNNDVDEIKKNEKSRIHVWISIINYDLFRINILITRFLCQFYFVYFVFLKHELRDVFCFVWEVIAIKFRKEIDEINISRLVKLWEGWMRLNAFWMEFSLRFLFFFRFILNKIDFYLLW